MLKLALTITLTLLATLSSHAGEFVIKDKDGADCQVYTPNKIDKNKTYWLVVGVHSLNGNGKGGAAPFKSWPDKYDCIVMGPTFTQGYQRGNGSHAEKVLDLRKKLSKEYKLHERIFLHGFSAGAQFSHRFTFNNPEMVAGLSAHSAGSWATGGPWGSINTDAKHIPMCISCGELDTVKSTPDSPMTRLVWYKEFEKQLQQNHFAVTSKVIPQTKHRQTKQCILMAEECFKAAQKKFPTS